MHLRIDPDGTARGLYDETIDFDCLGVVDIYRASRVDCETNGWWADLSPVGGPRLGPFARRSEALSAEQNWLEEHFLMLAG